MRLRILALCLLIAACGKPADRSASATSAAPPAAPPAAPSGTAPAASPQPAATASSDGAAVFGRTCITCHQANGQGLANMYPPLVGSPYVNGDKNRLIRIALHGLQGPITVEGRNYNNVMPPWKSLSDADMAAVLTYVRSSFGNSSGPVTAQEVAAQRQATGNRGPLTAAELR